MSMEYTPLHIHAGFFIDKEVAAHIQLKYDCLNNNVDPEIQAIVDAGQFNEMARLGTLPEDYIDNVAIFDTYMTMLKTPVPENCIYSNTFTGTIKTLAAGHPDPFDMTVEDESIICIIAEKEPSLFSTAYGSFQELINEFKSNEILSTLPNDFDYVKHIVVMNGTDYS